MKFSLTVPDTWNNNQKGNYFEDFVGDLLKPMRYEITKRLRFTGMEIDLLAKGLDHPSMILVECKAQSDTLSSDTISKIMGNREIRGADAAWLFSTSELSKDGRAQWEDIQANHDLRKKFTWYPPERICKILIDQEKIKNNLTLESMVSGYDIGDWTLVAGPSQWLWLVEFVEQGIPTSFTAFNAKDGKPLPEFDPAIIGSLSARFETQQYIPFTAEKPVEHTSSRVHLARVLSGDTWEDLRPARPIDFVGRDSIINNIFDFLRLAKDGGTTTRSFAIQAPSSLSDFSLRRC